LVCEVVAGAVRVGEMVETGEVAQIEALSPAGLVYLSMVSLVQMGVVEGVSVFPILAGTYFTSPATRECGLNDLGGRFAYDIVSKFCNSCVRFTGCTYSLGDLFLAAHDVCLRGWFRGIYINAVWIQVGWERG
jgi:hypothetical protein